MDKKIIWSATAKKSKHDILQYWKNRNKSLLFSIKLDQLIHDAVASIAAFPFSGKLTSSPDIRIKIVREYLLFYKVTDDKIMILLLWDGRRNPQDLPWAY